VLRYRRQRKALSHARMMVLAHQGDVVFGTPEAKRKGGLANMFSGGEIDPETGEIKIKRYVAVDDCGRLLNPLIVDGQVHGGVAQGLGQALWEGVVYDDNGNLLTGELMDYAVARAHMMPWIESSHTQTPSPVNPLGVKGVGEAGTIGSSPAAVNSVVDALSHLGVKHIDMPMTPEKIWKLVAGK